MIKYTILFITFFSCLSHAAEKPTKANDERPNIIVIMVDDMGFSDISCYGGEIPTPHLDKLGKNGLKFSQFHNTGRCCPTRATLLTGLYSHLAGMGWMTHDQNTIGYRGHLNNECVTIAEVLKPAGYFTAMTGKWHVGFEHGVTPSNRGFDRSLNMPAGGLHFSNQTGPKGGTKLYLNGKEISREDPMFNPPWYGSDLWTEQGIRFIDEAVDEEKPFFLYLAHVAPHFPCMAPEKTIQKYIGKYMKGWDVLRKERYQRQISSGLIDPSWNLPARPKEVPAWESLTKKQKIKYDDMMAIYAAMMEEVDKNIGKLVSALTERKLLDNTLILFFSDNGGNAEAGISGKYIGENPGDPHSNVFIGRCWAELNNTPFRKYKHYNHEGGTSTPLIAHWPQGIKERKNQKWEETPTHLIDIMATCIDLGQAEYPKQRNGTKIHPYAGTSLKPLFVGNKIEDRPLFWEHEGNAAVRVGDEKLVRLGRSGKWELYNLKKDRTELNDLADKNPKRTKELSSMWNDWAKKNRVIPYPEPKKKKQPNKNKAKA